MGSPNAERSYVEKMEIQLLIHISFTHFISKSVFIKASGMQGCFFGQKSNLKMQFGGIAMRLLHYSRSNELPVEMQFQFHRTI